MADPILEQHEPWPWGNGSGCSSADCSGQFVPPDWPCAVVLRHREMTARIAELEAENKRLRELGNALYEQAETMNEALLQEWTMRDPDVDAAMRAWREEVSDD